MLTGYQISELLIGSILFVLAYFSFRFRMEDRTLLYYDMILTTILFIIFMYLRYLYINYLILQSQKIST